MSLTITTSLLLWRWCREFLVSLPIPCRYLLPLNATKYLFSTGKVLALTKPGAPPLTNKSYGISKRSFQGESKAGRNGPQLEIDVSDLSWSMQNMEHKEVMYQLHSCGWFHACTLYPFSVRNSFSLLLILLGLLSPFWMMFVKERQWDVEAWPEVLCWDARLSQHRPPNVEAEPKRRDFRYFWPIRMFYRIHWPIRRLYRIHWPIRMNKKKQIDTISIKRDNGINWPFRGLFIAHRPNRALYMIHWPIIAHLRFSV